MPVSRSPGHLHYKLAESQASEMTIMAIAGHVSKHMLEHYSRIRVDAKRAALDAIAKPVFEVGVHQNVHRKRRLGRFS